MADLTSVARVVRWGSESLAFNLSCLPADKLDWKPNPESKSAFEVTGEALGVIRMMTGLIQKGHFERPPGASGGEGGPMQYPKPADLADARRQVKEAGEAFAAALDGAGPELDKPVETPFGTMLASRCVLWAMIDLIHHHGQVSYIQSLLGDKDQHFNPDGTNWFAPDA
jgi:hypothetical protein